MKNEKWKPVLGYEGLYEVSDLGRVRSFWYSRTGKVLSPGLKNNGYYSVTLSKEGKKKTFSVHGLVYTSFNGPLPDGMTIDHINGDKRDNRLENLQLLTRGDNARKGNNKQLDLLEADWPYREFTFSNSCEASEFFNYKYKSSVGYIISQARKRGENWINLRGTRYFFAQAN